MTATTSTGPRFVDGLDNDAYHADPALGSTSLKTLATRTPAHWLWDRDHPKVNDAFDLGTVVHALVLEDDESGVSVIDVPAKRGKVWTEPANEAREAGKIPVTYDEWTRVRNMRDSVMSHPIARNAFTGHVPERSLFWERGGVSVKARFDAWNRNTIIDLKSAVSADPREFNRAAAKFGYHVQQAHYQQGWEAVAGERPGFLFVVVEKEPPHLVSVVELHPDDVARGDSLVERALRVYSECLATNTWPGYASSSIIELPKWSRYQEEDLIDG